MPSNSPLRRCVLVGVAVVVSFGLAACGGGASKEELATAAHKGAAHRAEQERLRKLEKELKEIHKGAGSGANPNVPNPPTSTTPAPPAAESNKSCGNELTAGPSTTCEFAENVRSEYEYEFGSGSGTISAYSPANDTFYEMFCTAAPHECTGAIDAYVAFP